MAGRGHYTATSGAMFFAARLAYEHRLHVEVTRDNAPWIDLLVATPDGVSGVGVQVKATEKAGRQNKRESEPHEYQWDVGEKLGKHASPDLLVALVDLKEWREMPDFYLVTASLIQEHFRKFIEERGREPSRWRYHPKSSEIAHLRNDPTALLERLGLNS